LDGNTSWAEPFVLHTTVEPVGFVVRLPAENTVTFSGLSALTFDYILGDAICAGTASGRFTAAFPAHHSLVGELPSDGVMLVSGKPVTPDWCELAGRDDLRLFGCQRGDFWALHVGTATQPRADVLDGLLGIDMDMLLADRSRFAGTPDLGLCLDPADERLLRKSVSVMKVNCHSACGTIPRRWTTPDRWPHRHMWLWDSAFHAVGMSTVNVSMAQDAILAMAEQGLADGMLPHTIMADGEHSAITQPPVLAWAALRVLDAGGSAVWAAECLPHLVRYLDWMRLNRDRNGNGIPEWHIEGRPLCRCGECGLDNSSVYDGAVLLDAPDFGGFLCNDYACTAEIAERLDDSETAKVCRDAAELTADAVRTQLWCADDGFFYHRAFDGEFVRTKTVAGFIPLFAGIASREQAQQLALLIEDPGTFGAPFPVPSESLDSGTFCKDMWRGPSWMNLSYLVVLGLRRYGFNAVADRLRRRILDGISRWYERTGCLWEYYDSLDLTSPAGLDRKQRLIRGQGIAPISDYHWTAAVTAALLLEPNDGRGKGA